MPLTLTLTEGVLPVGTEKDAIKQLTDAMLKWHGLTGNTVMTPNITAMFQVLPKGSTFSGGQPFAGAWNLNGEAMTNEQLGDAIAKG